MYRMDILERALTYDEVTELFVGMNSLGAKLRQLRPCIGADHRTRCFTVRSS